MNAASVPVSSPSRSASTVWKWAMLLFPFLIILGLLWLRHVERGLLASRALGNLGEVPAFQLTNQDGQTFGSEQLCGKIWIADFVFTSCPGPCPMISSRMSEVQKPLKDTDVHLVSFTVDPDKDTPEVLKGYAEKLKAAPGRWDFLTGSKSSLYDLSRNGFKLAVSDGEGEQVGQPIHSTRFVLIDRNARIRGYYDALAPDAVTKLLADTSHLLREQPK